MQHRTRAAQADPWASPALLPDAWNWNEDDEDEDDDEDDDDDDDDDDDEYLLATAVLALIPGLLSHISCSASVFFLGVDFRAVLL